MVTEESFNSNAMVISITRRTTQSKSSKKASSNKVRCTDTAEISMLLMKASLRLDTSVKASALESINHSELTVLYFNKELKMAMNLQRK